ncbi:hypothetical protein Hanom_Chr12g01069121 [Helianthus anomalus]
MLTRALFYYFQIYPFRYLKNKSKLQKSSFMYATYYKLCPLSSIITENVLYVYKPLHVMSFIPNSVNFHG